MNLPNKLTILRVLMIPIFIVVLLADLFGERSWQVDCRWPFLSCGKPYGLSRRAHREEVQSCDQFWEIYGPFGR